MTYLSLRENGVATEFCLENDCEIVSLSTIIVKQFHFRVIQRKSNRRGIRLRSQQRPRNSIYRARGQVERICTKRRRRMVYHFDTRRVRKPLSCCFPLSSLRTEFKNCPRREAIFIHCKKKRNLCS